ncbi:hypothetical protein F4678DRAFT_483201 [Xylaria arbuscula]|nr:hypothetical protein F4678DRAFT_483201 [Xylaria arbuscula]
MSAPQAGPSAPPAQANQPSHARNPYIWVPPIQVQEDIREIVYYELFARTYISRQEMRDRISYRPAQVSFDENLRPHLVFAAFWSPDTLRTPLVTIRPARGTPVDWDRCYRELRHFVLEPLRLYPLVSVLFSDGERSQFHGPHAIMLDNQIVELVPNPNIDGILRRRSTLLRARSTQPMEVRQMLFLQVMVPLLEEMLYRNIASLEGVQEFVHRFRAPQ